MTSPESASAGANVGTVAAVIIGAFALVFSTIALISDDDANDVAAGGNGAPTAVTLSEFAIAPDPIAIDVGGTIDVTNTGSQIHNLAVEGTDLTTADLTTDEDEVLDVSSLAAGTYTVICTIPGHGEAGMTATLEIGGGGGGAAAHDDEDVDWEALDAAMTNSMLAFPAETEGRGNVPLEFEVLADGTKHFELTAEIVDWEVAPGQVVEAWTYNGMVPGPWIKVDVGDKVSVHVQNDLPMGTDIHWHGVRTPNDMDGVAPVTQELIRSGEDFTYRFTARKEAVGMYHAHHHAQMQVTNGMLGLFQIGDVALPRGRTISGVTVPEDLEIAQEIPMVLNDAGNIGLSLNGKSFPGTEPIVANVGDWLLVHYANEGLQIHPMHQHQFPQLIVAKDGIPLDQPYFSDTINVAPGERYSVLINTDEAGAWVWHCHILNHVEREDGMFGMVTAVIVQ